MHEPVVLADAVRKISEDSNGALELYVVLDADREQLARQAAEGEDLAVQLHQGIEDVRRTAPSADPVHIVQQVLEERLVCRCHRCAGRACHQEWPRAGILCALRHHNEPGAHPRRRCVENALAERTEGAAELRLGKGFAVVALVLACAREGEGSE